MSFEYRLCPEPPGLGTDTRPSRECDPVHLPPELREAHEPPEAGVAPRLPERRLLPTHLEEEEVVVLPDPDLVPPSCVEDPTVSVSPATPPVRGGRDRVS